MRLRERKWNENGLLELTLVLDLIFPKLIKSALKSFKKRTYALVKTI